MFVFVFKVFKWVFVNIWLIKHHIINFNPQINFNSTLETNIIQKIDAHFRHIHALQPLFGTTDHNTNTTLKCKTYGRNDKWHLLHHKSTAQSKKMRKTTMFFLIWAVVFQALVNKLKFYDHARLRQKITLDQGV